MRAIIFLLFVVLVFFIVRFTLNRIIAIREKQRQEELKQQATDEDNPQEMVRCLQSGIHIPKSEAYYDGENYFCSEEAMREYHKTHTD